MKQTSSKRLILVELYLFCGHIVKMWEKAEDEGQAELRIRQMMHKLGNKSHCQQCADEKHRLGSVESMIRGIRALDLERDIGRAIGKTVREYLRPFKIRETKGALVPYRQHLTSMSEYNNFEGACVISHGTSLIPGVTPMVKGVSYR